MAVRKENKSSCSVSCVIVMKYLIMIFAILTIKSGKKIWYHRRRQYPTKWLEQEKSLGLLQRVLFPLTNRAYRLLLTSPATVAKDERVFSRLKLIKTHLRTTMTEKRLEALMMLSCEKDLTDNANLDKIAESWAVLKSRKVKL